MPPLTNVHSILTLLFLFTHPLQKTPSLASFEKCSALLTNFSCVYCKLTESIIMDACALSPRTILLTKYAHFLRQSNLWEIELNGLFAYWLRRQVDIRHILACTLKACVCLRRLNWPRYKLTLLDIFCPYLSKFLVLYKPLEETKRKFFYWWTSHVLIPFTL